MSLGPLMVGVAGVTLTAEEKEMLRHPLVGGVILFRRNYSSMEQLQSLVLDLHSLRDPRLIIAVDHEGGRVQRFRNGFVHLPAVRRLGELYDHDPKRAKHAAQLSGWLMAAELRVVGIDISFAPVLDLDRGVSQVIGDRAFHSDPEIIADLAHAYMIGMSMAGMAATGKHFPGHGTAVADTHLELAEDERSFEDILSEDLVPFERMIQYGLTAIMAAHVIYPRIDAQPAGFSRYWLQDILRKRLGFQGVIFCDDLGMQGARVSGDITACARAALEAGCDMLLLCNELDCIPAVLDNLGEQKNPVSHLRLLRLHGRGQLDRTRLRLDPVWHEALAVVDDYGRPDEPPLV